MNAMRSNNVLTITVGVMSALAVTIAAQAPTQNPTGGQRGGGRGRFVTPVYDSVPPEIPADIKGQNTILIFSKTNGYREDPAIDASNDDEMKSADRKF